MKYVKNISRLFRRGGAICAGIVVLAALYHFMAFSYYCNGTLEGDVNNHILAAEIFGVPAGLEQKGLQPLYRGPIQTGWDGQFYFYIANDLLARKDTPRHIDSPSYRYQRVGMPLYAAAVAFAAGQSWVSPTTYILSYFALVMAATWFCAALLVARGLHPLFALFWPLSAGTQITMFNALPDAAADAFLILALTALYAGRFRLAILPLALSALSREVYILFPVVIGLMCWAERIARKRASGAGRWSAFGASLRHAPLYYLAAPVCVAAAWQIFVTLKFGIAANSQAYGILGAPLAAWFHYFVSGLHDARAEAGALFLFLLTLLAAAGLSLYVLATRKARTSVDRGVAITTLALAFLYACFGPTVMGYYTGYLKAAAVFAFLIPLLLGMAAFSIRWRAAGFAFLAVVLIAGSRYNWRVRILPGPAYDRYTQMSLVSGTREQPCLASYDAGIEIRGMELIERTGLMALITGARRVLIATVELRNNGNLPLVSTKTWAGSVHVGYQWLDEAGRIRDGTRSAIVKPLRPGDGTNIAIVAKLPGRPGRYTLRLLAVQEGCGPVSPIRKRRAALPLGVPATGATAIVTPHHIQVHIGQTPSIAANFYKDADHGIQRIRAQQ